jgi:DNA-binding CsgD family transcriptional regulator
MRRMEDERGPRALTQRETEVLAAIAEGMTCREIASALSMTEATAKTHRRNLMAKLGTSNAAHLLVRARELRLLAPSRPVCPLWCARIPALTA